MLRINNLNFAYPSGPKLFDDLNLNLEKGNIYGLLGKNGAGKTTFLKLTCGLLYPQKGDIRMHNIPVKAREPKILSDIYIIPEEFTLPDFKPYEFAKLQSPFYPKFDSKQFEDLLVEMEVDVNKRLNKMSFGQRKKFIIAFAVATNCSLVLMDEPTNGLDIPSKSKFRRIIASSIDENRCFLISTHQVRDLESLIDPVLIIDHGTIILNESIENLATKLAFVNTAKGETAEGKVYYQEKIFGGEYILCENLSNSESQVDFELLFNALLVNRKEIVEYLKS